MKLLAARVNWMEEYANDPVLELLVDHWPNLEDFTFDCRRQFVAPPTGIFYFAELDGAVQFFTENSDHNGFAGRKFKLRMRDGSTKELVGPWSGNPTAMALAGFPWTVCVHYADHPTNYENSFLTVGYLTIPRAEEAAHLAGVTIEAALAGPVATPVHQTDLAAYTQAVRSVTRYRVAGKSKEHYEKMWPKSVP